MYWHGHYGLNVDMEKSAALYEECARGGNARAQFVMASNYYNGEGVEKNYELAKMYANLALEQKYIYAWRRWGKFYRDGLAVPQNYEKARACYEKGAKMGDFNCYNKVADMLYHGWGSEVDYKGAVEYFEKGEQAPAFSQPYCLQRSKMALGRAYENGQGVEKNLKTAADKYLEGYHFGSLGCRDAYLRCTSQLPPAEGDAADPEADAE
ncbi:MAG: sel1 repeat family protein [Oscillospiraceae bacterium]|nr:sel1 repeat family protein [Oscillospiraceae bacterium]